MRGLNEVVSKKATMNMIVIDFYNVILTSECSECTGKLPSLLIQDGVMS